MLIKQFRYFRDNLGYMVYSGNEGVIIDPGDIESFISFADKNNITIKTVTNTHMHQDHASGNSAIIEATGAHFLDCRKVKADQKLQIGEGFLEIIPTPGHTDHCVTFKTEDSIISGDALFNGTVGNCFSGDLKSFFHSLKRLISLPPETKVYGGHDYVIDSMKMARIIEGDNPAIETYLQNYNPDLIVSTIDDELSVNPYVRFNAQGMISRLEEKNLPRDTEFDRFESIMEIY